MALPQTSGSIMRPRGRPNRSHRRARRLTGILTCLSALACVVAAPASADTTGLSGTVYSTATSQPQANVQISVYDVNDDLVDSTCSNSGGTYQFGGLDAGTYEVSFQSIEGDFKLCGGVTNFLSQVYNGAVGLANATPVTVTGGAMTTGIDGHLDPGGAIAGTVTDATTGGPVGGVEVDAYDSGGALASSTCTAGDGTYSLFALANGSYRVEFQNAPTCGNTTSYVPAYYANSATLAAAQPVAVTVSATTPGVDGALQPSAPSTLTVATAGSGSVQVSPSNANCTGQCSYPFTTGATLTLTATPSAGSSFVGWTGGNCSGTGPCTVTLNSDETITANFGSAVTNQSPPVTPPGSGLPNPSPPMGGGGGGKQSAPQCGLVVASSLVRVRTLRHGRKIKPANVSVVYSCNELARLTISGTVRLRWPSHVTHGHRSKAIVRSVRFASRTVNGHIGWGQVTLKLPAAALRALTQRTTVTSYFKLAFANPGGSGWVAARAMQLHARISRG